MKKRIGKNRMLLMLAAVTLLCAAAGAVPSGELLQQGLYAEEIEGDLAAAIASYEQVINDPEASEKHVAQALYRQGMCYVRLKDDAKAVVALTRLVTNYSSQTNLVEKVRPVLGNLQFFDPAALMPPETLAYLELGSPGKQLETLLGMLKDTPYENPLAAISKMNPDAMSDPGPGMLMASILNPSMMAEFKKIRGAAVGVLDIGKNGPSVIAVLHPGDSDALRGLLMTGLGMVGTPGALIEGMSTLSIQGQVDVAYDNKVLIASIPAGRLPWSIRQYKHVAADSSLASGNPSFIQLDKSARQQNAATLWINTDGLYARLAQQIPDFSPEIKISAGVINLSSMDDLMLTAALASDGLGLEGRIHFKEDLPNMAYELIKTPKISREGLKGIPSGAFCLASFDFAEADSMQVAQLRQLAMNTMGMDLSAELFENIKQITVFALPGTNTVNSDLPFRPGLVVSCKDSAPLVQFLETIKAMANGGPELVVEAVDGAVLVALEQDVVASAKVALNGGASVNNGGALKASVDQYADAAQKMALVSVGGIVRLAGPGIFYVQPHPAIPEEMAQQIEEGFAKLAKELEGTILSIHTEESPRELALKARFSGIPELSKIGDSFVQIKQAQTQARLWQSRQVSSFASNLDTKAATVLQAPEAPAIDGELDELWQKARVYPVEKPVTGIYDNEHGNPIPDNAFAADFRMLYDSTNLYVFMDVTDSTPNHNPELGWQFSDNAIIYIDATDAKSEWFGSTDYEFAFCWDSTTPIMYEKKHNRMQNVAYKIKTTDKGYCVEAAFPWATLGTPAPGPGTKIGVDVQVSDNQAGPKRNQLIGWQDDTNGAWRHPYLFGRAELAGLVGYWPCDEMEGSTVGDESGRGCGGIFEGNVKWAEGRVGGALDMDGQGSYVRIANEAGFDLTGEITIACWLNIRSVTADWMPFVTKGNTSWRLSTEGSEARFHMGLDNSPSGARICTEQSVGLGEWHHVAATYDGKTMQFYVDGKLAAEEAYDGGIIPNNSPVLIGANAEAMERFFDGLIDEVRVYNRVLKVDEIEELAAAEGK